MTVLCVRRVCLCRRADAIMETGLTPNMSDAGLGVVPAVWPSESRGRHWRPLPRRTDDGCRNQHRGGMISGGTSAGAATTGSVTTPQTMLNGSRPVEARGCRDVGRHQWSHGATDHVCRRLHHVHAHWYSFGDDPASLDPAGAALFRWRLNVWPSQGQQVRALVEADIRRLQIGVDCRQLSAPRACHGLPEPRLTPQRPT